jgi:hypothetical protein
MERGKQGSLRREATGGRPVAAVSALVLLLVGALLAAGVAPAGGAKNHAAKPKKKASAPLPFCSNPVEDYRAPMETLQPIPALPEGGVLPFAPAGITIGATGPQGVLVEGSNVGFRLANGAPASAAKPPRLDWIVLERLIRLTDNGHGLHPAGLKRIDLAQLPPGKHRRLTFPIPSTPAIYSVEVTIQNHRGRLLGRYGEYIRVVGRTVNTGLTLAAFDNLAPGTTLEGCFENHGSASVLPGSTSIERNDNGTWRPVTVGPTYAVPTPVAPRILGPGESEKLGFYIPPNARPGLYRAVTSGAVLAPGALTPSPPAETVALSAEFGVL